MLKKIITILLSLILVSLSTVPAIANSNYRQNDYPIILVHGLTGWGPDELLGFNYWGGLVSISNHLNRNGFRTYEAVVGPFSGNRTRAIELYYFIKGGTVDYGAAHSAKHGSERFGRTFPGIYQNWNDENKIHLIGHSMGGLTARFLANLIAEGCQIEMEFFAQNPEVGISSLLSGNSNGGIHSITTVATPNNGMTAAHDHAFTDFLSLFLTTIASMSGISPERIIYDFKLDQYGLSREFGESFLSYKNRVFSSSIWQAEHLANFDLSVRGVTQNSENLRTRSDIYYFSHSPQITHRLPLTNIQTPMLTMNPLFVLPAAFMNRYTNSNSVPVINNSWAASDGLVNTISMPYPFGHPSMPYNGNPVRGVWNYHPILMGWDHLDIVGIGTIPSFMVNQLYLDIAIRLSELPR